MKNLFSPARVSFALMALILQAPAQELPALENPEFFGEADGTVGKWSLRFSTVPGCEYTVQQSTDLNEWTAIPGATYYGTGAWEKCYICDGPIPTTLAPSPSPQPTQGLGWHLEHWNLNLELVAEGLSSSYRLSRPSYTPFGETEPLAAWDVVLTSPEFAAQALGRRYLSMIHWQDNARHTLMLVSCMVQSTENATFTDSLATTDEQAADLTLFDHILPQLQAQLAIPYTPSQPDSPGMHKFARLVRTDIDTNSNGLPDWWELQYGYSPFAGNGQPGFCYPDADDDNDGLSNLNEYLYHTAPTDADSDHDGLTDPREILKGTDPLDPDTDHDGLPDGDEANTHHTNPNNPDTDFDGIPDLTEIENGTNPNDKDSDGDGYPDKLENDIGTNPNDGTSHPGDEDHPDDPEHPYPAPTFEANVVGESRDLTYVFSRVTRPLGLPGQYYPVTTGHLDAKATWAGAPTFHEDYYSITQRILAPDLGDKFTTAGTDPFCLPPAIRGFADGASGSFLKAFKYLFPSGSSDSDEGSLLHSTIALHSSAPIHPAITKTFVVFATLQNGNLPPTDLFPPYLQDITLGANEPVSQGTIKLTVLFKEVIDGVTQKIRALALTTSIAPADNMAGVIGDIVPSAKPGSTIKHFVTPKLTESDPDLSKEWVELKAEGITHQLFREHLEWEGEGIILDGEDSTKCKVPRNQARDPFKIKIKHKTSGLTLSEMHVWVVWGTGVFYPNGCACSVGPERGATIGPADSPRTAYGTNIDTKKGNDSGDFFSKFTLFPRSIFNIEEEVPNFLLPVVETVGGPLAGNHILSGRGLWRGVTSKWDITRRMKITASGPVKKDDFPKLAEPLFAAWPATDKPTTPIILVPFPADPLVGNDDSNSDTEDTLIYEQITNAKSEILNHQIGEMTKLDSPNFTMLNDSDSALGDKFEYTLEMQDFCRLQIGSKWYIVSTPVPWYWRAKFEARRRAENGILWENDGSIFEAGVPASPPAP